MGERKELIKMQQKRILIKKLKTNCYIVWENVFLRLWQYQFQTGFILFRFSGRQSWPGSRRRDLGDQRGQPGAIHAHGCHCTHSQCEFFNHFDFDIHDHSDFDILDHSDFNIFDHFDFDILDHFDFNILETLLR